MINQKTAQEAGVTIVDSQQVLTTEKQALIEQLKVILPNVINADNQLDIKALQDVVDISNTTSNNQGYELTFAGKGIARAMADKPCELELKTELAQSKNFDDTGNVVIRGDNLEVLKILQANYHKKIKMIYIDPPYNTKSENFIYKDNFKKSDEDLIENFELDEDSVDFLHNVYGTRSHSGWLSFIYPRLKLARDLLTDDGVIFISIDDNEQANLKILCDEIFGGDNFRNNIVIKRGVKSVQAQFKDIYSLNSGYELVLCYTRNTQYRFEHLTEILEENNSEGSWNNHWRGTDRKTMRYELFGVTPKKGQYRWSQKRSKDGIENYNRLLKDLKKSEGTVKEQEIDEWYFKKTNENALPKIDLLRKNISTGKAEHYIPPKDDKLLNDLWVALYASSSSRIKSLFSENMFSNPKDTRLIERLCAFCDLKSNDIAMDFFAGSGTTADAVMQLNAEDGGSRKFVLVQIDDPIDEKKSAEAYQFCTDNQFKPVISSITIERLNRAGEKIKKDLSSKQGDLLDNKQCPDIGYKVFSCTPKPQVGGNGIFKVENNRNNVLDTLINMLVATCKTLDTKIECLIKNKLYQADNEIYLLANVDSKVLEKYQDVKINLDGWADIDLTQYLNLGIGQADNISVIY